MLKEKVEDHVWLEINLGALRSNLARIRQEVGPDVSIMAVVKSNAYGHGIQEVARALGDQVEFLAVANLKEALWIRQAGVKTPMLIFGVVFPEEAGECLEKNLSVTISSLDQARALSCEAALAGRSLKIHVKIDTGMGRMGILADEAARSVLEISRLPKLALEGIMTHFPVADLPEDPFTREQVRRFRSILDMLESQGMEIPFQHAANSAAIFNFHESHFNLVRPGLSLYGAYSVSVGARHALPLHPVMSLKAKVQLIKKLPKGHSVSYGRNFRLPEEGYVACLPVGYGHGIPFSLSGKREVRVLIREKYYPICGNICMDHTLVWLGTSAEVETGDEAVLIGRQGNKTITACELAKQSSTIPYEILTRMSPEIERWHVD